MKALALRTAAPGDVESKITSLWRGGDIWIRTERKLAVDTIPNEDENHRAEQFRPGLPNILSGVQRVQVSVTKAMIPWRCVLTVFLPTGLDIERERSLDRSQTGTLAVRPCESWVVLHFCRPRDAHPLGGRIVSETKRVWAYYCD